MVCPTIKRLSDQWILSQCSTYIAVIYTQTPSTRTLLVLRSPVMHCF